MSKSKHETITEAQHAVMEQVKMLDKDSEAHDFDYTSAAFALLVLRPLMIKHGISKFKVGTTHHGRWQNGIGVDYELVFRYQLVGATELIEGVTYQDVPVQASGKVGKSGDKSTFASQTTGAKYADVDFFNLPMTDDIEGFEEAAELLEEMYNTDDKPKKEKKKLKLEEPKDDPEEEDDDEIPSSSRGINYADGVLDIIRTVFEEMGEEAMLEFVEGDTRNKVEALVEELLGNEEEPEDEDEEYDDEPEEEEEEYDDDEPEEDDGEGVSLDDLDYEDPETVEALLNQIDIEDEEMINNILETSFTDVEALKGFYTVCTEAAGEISAEFQEEFTDRHFPILQEVFEDLENL